MKLKAVVGTLEGLSEGIAALYKKEGEIFVLDIDGVDDHPGVQNLSRTMKTERAQRDEFEKKFKTLQDKISGIDIDRLKDIDPDKYEKSIAELNALKLEQDKRNMQKLKDEKEWEKLEQTLRDQHTKDLGDISAKHLSERDALLKQMEGLTTDRDKTLAGMGSALERHLKDKELTTELAKAKGNIPLLTPHISPFIDIKKDENGNYSAIVIGPDKNQRFNNAGKPMTIAELVLEFKEKPEFKGEGVFEILKQSGGSGSGGFLGDGGTKINPWAKDTLNFTKQNEEYAKDPVAAKIMMEAAGVKSVS